MWLKILEATGVPFSVLVRTRVLYEYVKQHYPEISVIFATTPQQVENALTLLPDAKAVLYPSNTGNNIHLLRFNHLRHVFIGHGDSDKSGSAHKFFRVYDEIWVAGQAHIDRFRNAGFDIRHISFVKVGRPALKLLCQASPASRAPLANTSKSLRILYLPTWEGVYQEQSYSSLYLANVLIPLLQRKLSATISIKLHPWTGKTSPELRMIAENLAADANVRILPPELSLDAALSNEADIIACDVSGVLTDALALDVPLLVYENLGEDAKIASSDFELARFAYTYSSLEELEAKLDRLVRDGDYLAEPRGKAMQYFMGKEETLSNSFSHALHRVAAINQSSLTQ
jgi:CDP-glycerol glycerophosphotransferase (TagB/SpsB family)